MVDQVSEATFEGWVILELMGHRRLAGYLKEQELAGSGFLRLDIPARPASTQFYAPGAVYCITPTTEEIARAFAAQCQPAPVQRWELPALRPAESETDDEDIPY